MEKLLAESALKFIDGFGIWAPLIIVLIYAALIAYAFYRSGSIYFILDKLWRLAGGEKEFKNQSANEIWNGIRDVEAFRFRTGISVSTLKQVNEIESFLHKYDMGFHDIIPFAIYFDPVSVKLKEINYKRNRIVFFVLAVICYLLMSLPQFITSFTNFNYAKSAHVTLKESGKVVYLQKRQGIIEGHPLTSEECVAKDNKEISNKHLITEIEASALCNELTSSESEYYKNTIKEQNVLVGLWLALFVFLMIIFVRKAYSVSKAIDFQKKIDTVQEKETESSTATPQHTIA